jgi:hypothetical protein
MCAEGRDGERERKGEREKGRKEGRKDAPKAWGLLSMPGFKNGRN